MADNKNVPRQRYEQKRSWLVFQLAAFSILIFSAACTPTNSQLDITVTPESTSGAKSLASIAETATVKANAPSMQEGTGVNPGASEVQAEDSGLEQEGDNNGGTTIDPSSDENVTNQLSATVDSSQTSSTPALSESVQSTPSPIPTEAIRATAISLENLNGIPVNKIVDISREVEEHIREIYARGQLLGRSANSFSKLGDSLIATPHFLTYFDQGLYNLGDYAGLQKTIDYFEGSYERYGVGIKAGLHSWAVFDPLWANKDWCQPNEDLLTCEFRLNNPSVLLILLGSNDSGAPDSFDHNLRMIVEYSIENGVIPVIATKADRFEGADNRNNIMLRQIAADYQVPLWDFDLVAETIIDRGLQEDQVHLTEFPSNDYTLEKAFQTGHTLHNLTALMVLDRIIQIVSEEIE